VAAPQVDGATGGAMERRRDAGDRVKIVIVEIAVGAVGEKIVSGGIGKMSPNQNMKF
jgi:hypothetical protein